VSQDHSRKHFLAKLLGLFAGIGLSSRLIAGSKSSPTASFSPSDAPKASPALQVRPDVRAVSRHDNSV
jgi:hypothetical protein